MPTTPKPTTPKPETPKPTTAEPRTPEPKSVNSKAITTKTAKPKTVKPVGAKAEQTTTKQPNKSAFAARRMTARTDATGAYHDRRAEIAAAAARVFNRKGYVGTTIAAVAKEMKTDRASLYYYISSKEELFDEVVREVSDANVAAAELIQASCASAPEKLRQLIESLMQSYADNFPLLYIYIRENLTQVTGKRSAWSSHMRALNHRYDQAIISIVEEGIADGSLKSSAPATVIAFGVIGMVGWTNRWFDPNKSPSDAAAIGRGFADMILNGLTHEATTNSTA